jgi:thioredoxin reductase
MAPIEEVAFPRLTSTELALVKPLATPRDFADGETIFRAGQTDIDLYLVESGQVEIRNPADGDHPIVSHGPGQFSGDIDVLTGRPVLVTAVAKGATRVLQVPNSDLRALLNRVPSLGEKLIIAFTRRRELLSQLGTVGLRVIGPGRCRDTNTVREFLYKNFVPFTWADTETGANQHLLAALGSPRKTPVIDCGGGRILVNPSLQELAGAARFAGAGIYYACTTVEADLYDNADVAVVGGGNSAGQAVMFLAECCRSRQVHLLIRRTLGPGMSEYLSQRIQAAPNVVVHEGTEIEAIHGSRHMEAIALRNNATKAVCRVPCGAVFVFIGAEPSAQWLPVDIARDAKGYVLTGTDVVRSGSWPRGDRDPCPLETTVPGILAAGDIRSGSTKRVGFAVGDGSLAVTSAHRLLSISR